MNEAHSNPELLRLVSENEGVTRGAEASSTRKELVDAKGRAWRGVMGDDWKIASARAY